LVSHRSTHGQILHSISDGSSRAGGARGTTDPAIRLTHCRGPIVPICWTTRQSPPVWPLPAASRTSPSKSRNPKSALYFMALDLSSVSTACGQKRDDTPQVLWY